MTRTIRMYLEEHGKVSATKRLEQLLKLNAPDFMLEQQRAKIAASSAVRGDQSLLDRIVITAEARKGRGGKVYVHFTTESGNVNYFPAAKFGQYIAEDK